MIPNYLLKSTQFGFLILYKMMENDRPIEAKIIEYADLYSDGFRELMQDKCIRFCVQGCGDLRCVDKINI